MNTALVMLAVWALIGAVAGGLAKSAPGDKVFFDHVINGALGGCVAGSLFHKLELGLPFYVGSLLSAVAGAILVVILLDRLRAT
jgi:uncharacterized membrane protein YeaQ/YmgE (transglycosylase-associated protein family)